MVGDLHGRSGARISHAIHIGPSNGEDRLNPAIGEGELINGIVNRSSVDVLVEHITGFVVLAEMVNVRTK